MSYTIQISAQQLAILTASLAATAAHGPGYTNVVNSDIEEAIVLRELLQELPADAASLPFNTVFGLCL